jgi:glutathione S-transferase
MLMLEHKGVPYRRADIVTLLHPVAVRLRGFDAGGERRAADGRRTLAIRTGDLLGTVPALAYDGRRVSTNRQIARFLDDRHPEPPLFPADADRRREVEEAERWANEELQMTARRIALAWAVREGPALAPATADGRMGYLLYRRAFARRLIIPLIGRLIFAVDRASDRELMDGLPAVLDRIDAWIDAGVLGGERLNAADFMVAPSLALMLYRPDVLTLFEGRPALELVDRLLPEPA